MASQEELRRLRHVLVDYFNEDQVRRLCMDLGIAYDSLPGNSSDARARELVQEINAQDRILDLLQAIYEIRPNAFWGEAKAQAADARFRQALMDKLGMQDVPDMEHIPIFSRGGMTGRQTVGDASTDAYRALLHLSLERIHRELDVQAHSLGSLRHISTVSLALSVVAVLGILVSLFLLMGNL